MPAFQLLLIHKFVHDILQFPDIFSLLYRQLIITLKLFSRSEAEQL